MATSISPAFGGGIKVRKRFLSRPTKCEKIPHNEFGNLSINYYDEEGNLEALSMTHINPTWEGNQDDNLYIVEYTNTSDNIQSVDVAIKSPAFDSNAILELTKKNGIYTFLDVACDKKKNYNYEMPQDLPKVFLEPYEALCFVGSAFTCFVYQQRVDGKPKVEYGPFEAYSNGSYYRYAGIPESSSRYNAIGFDGLLTQYNNGTKAYYPFIITEYS